MPVSQTKWTILFEDDTPSCQSKVGSGQSSPVYGVDSVQAHTPVSAQHESVCSMSPSAGSHMSANQPVKHGAFSREATLYRKGAMCIPQSIGTTRVHEIHPIGDPITVKLTGPYPDGGDFNLSEYCISAVDETGDGHRPSPRTRYVGNLKAGGGCVAFGGDLLDPKDEKESVAQWAASCITFGSHKIAEHVAPNVDDDNESD